MLGPTENKIIEVLGEPVHFKRTTDTTTRVHRNGELQLDKNKDDHYEHEWWEVTCIADMDWIGKAKATFKVDTKEELDKVKPGYIFTSHEGVAERSDNLNPRRNAPSNRGVLVSTPTPIF